MHWGDVPAWVGVSVSIIVAASGWRQSRNARSGAELARDRADEAMASSASMASSLTEISTSLAKLADLRSHANGGPSPLPDPSKPMNLPAWNVEYRTGSAYVLRNVGLGSASHVTIDARQAIARRLPDKDGVDLGPGQGHEFLLIGAFGSPVPVDLVVNCAELDPQHVAVPTKP
jgi:hypothetical protein